LIRRAANIRFTVATTAEPKSSKDDLSPLASPRLSHLIIRDFISLALINRTQTSNMSSTVSTTVKILVSMVVVAALVATTFNSKVRSFE
jgi:hypothetical protein